ncbi:unnamed protein product, partial [Effrenium voratum]
MCELQPLDLHLKIVAGAEMTPALLNAYDKHLHEKVFPPSKKSLIKELAGDGHEKVAVKCAQGRQGNRDGRPRKATSKGISKKKAAGKTLGHGWFMVVAPRRIALPQYKAVDTFVFDRQCSFAPSKQYLEEFKQIKYWSVDKNYARTLNSCSPLRHVFKVMYFSNLHNFKVQEVGRFPGRFLRPDGRRFVSPRARPMPHLGNLGEGFWLTRRSFPPPIAQAPPASTERAEEPPLLVRSSLVAASTALMTPLFPVIGFNQLVFRYATPEMKLALHGGTSMVYFSAMTLVPNAFYYAPILLPFALGNGLVV